MPFDGNPGTLTGMAARSSDPDAERARNLATILTALAERIDAADADNAAEIDPKWGDPLAVAKKQKARARTLIRKLHAVSLSVHADNEASRDALRRADLVGACQMAAAALRHVTRSVPAEARPSDVEQNLVQMAVGSYVNRVEEHRQLVERNIGLVRDLVRAIAGFRGGPKVKDAAESLFDAMGYPANYESQKRASRRHRAR